jgi:hypothetical protein
VVCTSILTEPTSETATLAEFDRVPAAVRPDPEAISRRTAELVADLVEPATSDALEKLDGAPVQRFSPAR